MKDFQEKSAAGSPELGRETIETIEKARARIKKGQFLTEEEVKKRLELK